MTNSPDISKTSPKDRRQILIQTAAEIATLAIHTSSLDDLLTQSVKLISERFGYYHVAVFLTDDAMQYAALRAAAGSAASEIEKSGLRIVIGSRSIIGWVGAHNQYRLAADVSQEFFFQKNDLLEETRSEIAIPISARAGPIPGAQTDQPSTQTTKVLGVLDVQHDRENAFDTDTITVLQTIANDMAAVIQNFRLVETTRRSLAEVSAVYRASSLIARARNIQEIQGAIQQVLQESQYKAQLLVIQPGSISSEDAFIPYQSSHGDPGLLEAYEASPEPWKPTHLLFTTAESCLQEPQSAKLLKVQSGGENIPEKRPDDKLARTSTPAKHLKPYLLLDLGADTFVPASTESPASSGVQQDQIEVIANYARSLNLVSAAFIPVTRFNHLEMLILIGSTRDMLLVEHLQSTISLADLATTALERVYAMQIMEKRQGVVQALNVIGHAVSVQSNLHDLYQVIYNEIKSLSGDVGFFIALYEPGNETLNTDPTISIPYMIEMGSDKVDELPPFALGEGLTSIVINTRKPLILMEDAERRSQEMGARLIGSPAKSWLGVPLLVADEVIGAIVVQDTEHERRFDEDDLLLISTLALQVAVAIRNARLLENLHQRAAREIALNEITSQIRSSGNAQKILQTATEEVARLIGASRASITLKTDHGESS